LQCCFHLRPKITFKKVIYDIRDNALCTGPADGEVQVTQSLVMNQALHRVQEATSRMGQEHKDLHSTVSKVGKTIDRVCAY
jgi:hypothetical protein